MRSRRRPSTPKGYTSAAPLVELEPAVLRFVTQPCEAGDDSHADGNEAIEQHPAVRSHRHGPRGPPGTGRWRLFWRVVTYR